MGPVRNAALAARIDELGLTETELANLINDAVEVSTGRRGRSTDRYVRLLLDGSIRWPWPANRRALEQVLGATSLELGLTPHGRELPTPPDPTAEPTVTPTPSPEEDMMDRREVLGIVAGTTISIAVPALPAQGRVGVTDVARLAAPFAELISIDQRLGGVAMAPVCLRQADRVLQVARGYEHSDRVERSLYGLAAQYLAQAGWSAVDADQLDEAGAHLDRALRAASTATDPMVQAEIRNIIVMRARQAGDMAHAHAAAKAGLHTTAARTNPKVAALFHARVAHGHAYRGEAGMAQRSLHRAHDALAKATPDTPTPAWLEFFNRAELAALTAMTYNVLGRFALAVRHAELARDTVPTGYVRNRTLYLMDLAEAHLGRREVEHAAATATTALESAGQLREGVRRGRTARRLRHLRVRFSHVKEVSAARDWIDVFDNTVAPARVDHAVAAPR